MMSPSLSCFLVTSHFSSTVHVSTYLAKFVLSEVKAATFHEGGVLLLSVAMISLSSKAQTACSTISSGTAASTPPC